MSTLRDRVRCGAAFLDERYPGWRDRIDMDRLDITSCTECVLGQAAGIKTGAEWQRYLTMGEREALGFDAEGVWPTDQDYADLQAAWVDELMGAKA